MVVIAGVAVALALLIAFPWLVVVFMASAVPAVFITEFKAFRRRRRGDPMSEWQRIAWVVGLTVLIPVVLVAVAIALLGVCIAFTR
jgi:hypothetical protein